MNNIESCYSFGVSQHWTTQILSKKNYPGTKRYIFRWLVFHYHVSFLGVIFFVWQTDRWNIFFPTALTQLSAPLAQKMMAPFICLGKTSPRSTIRSPFVLCFGGCRFFLNKKPYKCAASRLKTSQMCCNAAMFYMEIKPHCRIIKNYRR